MLHHIYYGLLASTLRQVKPAHSMTPIRPGWTVDDHSFHKGRIAEWSDIVTAVADMCERDNPRFNRSKFINACHR